MKRALCSRRARDNFKQIRKRVGRIDNVYRTTQRRIKAVIDLFLHERRVEQGQFNGLLQFGIVHLPLLNSFFLTLGSLLRALHRQFH